MPVGRQIDRRHFRHLGVFAEVYAGAHALVAILLDLQAAQHTWLDAMVAFEKTLHHRQLVAIVQDLRILEAGRSLNMSVVCRPRVPHGHAGGERDAATRHSIIAGGY